MDTGEEERRGGARRSPITPPPTHLHEVVDGLQVGQVVVIDVHADAEVEASVASVNDLKVPELWGRETVSDRACPGPSVLGRVEPKYLALYPMHGPCRPAQ